jgi:hypothetical protein
VTSIGHVSSALWALTRSKASRGWWDRLVHPFRSESAATPAEGSASRMAAAMRAWMLTYRDVLRANAWQVRRLASRYFYRAGEVKRKS